MSEALIIENVSKRFWIPREHADSDRAANARARMLRWAKTGLSQFNRKREFWALSDVSFQVDAGERIAIVGQNGSGKSTLLRIIANVLEPTNGKVYYKGRITSLLEVGVGFHPELTGRENVFLYGSILGMTRAAIRREFDNIVAFAEIEQFLDVPVKRYSSGMFVRLAFSVATALAHDTLIIDEALAVGDFAFQQKCIGRLEEECERGKTLLFVSHNVSTVQSICHRAIVIDQGKLVADTTVDEATKLYLPQRSEETTFQSDQLTAIDQLECGVKQTKHSFEFALALTSREDCVLEITMRLKDQQNQPIGWAAIRPLEDSTLRLCRGKQTLEFSLPTEALAPGIYTAGFDIFAPKTGNTDQLDACLTINKKPNEGLRADRKDQDSGFGCIRFQPTQCSFENKAQPSQATRAA